MRFSYHPVKILVLFTFLTAPVYADQSFINATRSRTVKQIAEFYLKHSHHTIVNICRMGKYWNSKGLSFFKFNISDEYLSEMTKKSGLPYDVIKKDNEGKNYAMYSVCPDVY